MPDWTCTAGSDTNVLYKAHRAKRHLMAGCLKVLTHGMHSVSMRTEDGEQVALLRSVESLLARGGHDLVRTEMGQSSISNAAVRHYGDASPETPDQQPFQQPIHLPAPSATPTMHEHPSFPN